MNKVKTIFTLLGFSFLTCIVPANNHGKINIENISSAQEISSDISSNLDFYDKQNNLTKSVVKLSFEIKSPWGIVGHGSATGFSVAYDREKDKSYVITNDHFCQSLNEVFPVPGRFYYQTYDMIMVSNQKNTLKGVSILKTDPSKDLCLMVADGYVKPAKIASKKYKARQMDPVSFIGAPAGIFPIKLDTYLSSLVSRDILPSHMSEGNELYLLSEVAMGGHSGSPVFNKKGEVIGVLFLSLENSNGRMYGSIAIPLGDLHEFLDKNSIKY